MPIWRTSRRAEARDVVLLPGARLGSAERLETVCGSQIAALDMPLERPVAAGRSCLLGRAVGRRLRSGSGAPKVHGRARAVLAAVDATRGGTGGVAGCYVAGAKLGEQLQVIVCVEFVDVAVAPMRKCLEVAFRVVLGEERWAQGIVDARAHRRPTVGACEPA